MKPPAVARWLAARLVRRDDRTYFLGDLEEEFERIGRRDGWRAARRWYWMQLAGSARSLTSHRRQADTSAVAGVVSGSMVDAAHAARWIGRNRLFACAVVATLTIAFASVLAGYMLIDGLILRPLPFPDAERIVSVGVAAESRPNLDSASLLDVDDWRAQTTTFDALSASSPDAFRLTGRGEPRQVQVMRVGRDFDRVLGVAAAAGRLLKAQDFQAGAEAVAVLTHGFWRREFGSDPAAVGGSLLLNERPFRIIGILPPTGVTFPEPHEAWIPLIARPGAFWENSRATGWVNAVGRIAGGRSTSEASTELATVAARTAAQHPTASRERLVVRLSPISERIVGPLAPALWLLASALCAVLLIAAGNMTTLLLASMSRRRAEFAVRVALGAGRARMVRQLIAESLILSGAAAALGLMAAPHLVRVFLSVYPTALPREIDATVTARLAAAAALVALVTALLTSLPQLLRAWRGAAPQPSSQRATMSRAERTAGFGLVTTQVALSLVLVLSGVALVRTMAGLQRVNPGFQTDGVLTFSVTPSPQRFPSAAASRAFYDSLVTSIRGIPGVRSAAAAVGVPLTSRGWRFGIRPAGAPADVPVWVNLVSPGYFETLGIRTIAGRVLTDAEQRSGVDAVLVNDALARLLAADGRAVLGRTFDYSDRRWLVVGIVDTPLHSGPRAAMAPELFIPWHMAGRRPQTIAVRAATGDPMQLVPAIAERVRELDPTAPLVNLRTLDARWEATVAADRFRTILLATLASIGVLLAAVGAFSTTAFAVARRTREFGIRLALGERRPRVWARACGTAVAPAAAGVLIGAAVSFWAARFVDGFLFGVSSRDPLVLAGAGLGLLAIALAAASVSARRAATLDPIAILRID